MRFRDREFVGANMWGLGLGMKWDSVKKKMRCSLRMFKLMETHIWHVACILSFGLHIFCTRSCICICTRLVYMCK